MSFLTVALGLCAGSFLVIYALIFAVPVSLLFTGVVSFFSKKPDTAPLAACFPQR